MLNDNFIFCAVDKKTTPHSLNRNYANDHVISDDAEKLLSISLTL